MLMSLKDEVQMKYLNTSVYAALSPALAGTLVQPALPAQGSTNGQREGDSIAIDSIQFRLFLFNAGSSLSDNDIIRVVCLQSRSSTILTTNYSTNPTTGIFDLGSNGTLDITSFVNFNAKNETFHVLMDRSFCVTEASSSAAHLIEGELVPKVKKINYTPGTTTALDGAIFWVAFGYATIAIIGLEQRLVYHDL
jgi:hypothetical protein